MYRIYKNKIFKTKIGKLIKFVNKNNEYFKKFGEIYFNHIKISKKKNDWILHKKYQCIILVINGNIQFTLRKKKKTKNLNLNNEKILVINPSTWFRFSSKTKSAIFVNLIDGIHDPKETIREITK